MAWRDRLALEFPNAAIAHLSAETLHDGTGAPLQLEVELAILFAPDSQGDTDAEVDALVRCVEHGLNDPGAAAHPRVVVVGDGTLLHAPRADADFISRARAESDLLPFVRGTLACASGLKAARRELALLGRVVDSMREEVEVRDDELQLAAMVQRDFLPLPMASLHGVRVATLYRPLAQVSGDVYHLEHLDDDRIAIFLGDAVGHGIPAALLGMAVCRSLEFTNRIDGQLTLLGPGETLSRANIRLLEHQRATTRFATAVAAVLDCRKRTIRVAAAGHPAVVLLRPGEPLRQVNAEGGILGVFEGEIYSEVELDLQPNDRLLFYSDGFEQAFAEHGEPQHLREFAELAGVLDPDQLIERITARLDAQHGSLHQADDLTMLCVSIGEALGAVAFNRAAA